MTANYRVYVWSETASPCTHMRGVEGNEAMLAREPIDTPAGKRWIPVLSANAIRHRCIREPGALYLVQMLGLRGRLTLQQLNFLLHGGNLTDSTGREDTARIAEMQELFPLLRLLGGALPDQILKGSLLAWRGILVCEENRNRIQASLPNGFTLPVQSLKPSEHYVESYQYTRGDAAKRVDWYNEESRDPEAKSNLMIYAGQQVISGAAFFHGFDIPHSSELELGCLLHSLSLWQAQGGSIGAMASKGHGRLNSMLIGFDWDRDALIEQYTQHVADHAEQCVSWLEKVFTKKEKKEKKEKGAPRG